MKLFTWSLFLLLATIVSQASAADLYTLTSTKVRHAPYHALRIAKVDYDSHCLLVLQLIGVTVRADEFYVGQEMSMARSSRDQRVDRSFLVEARLYDHLSPADEVDMSIRLSKILEGDDETATGILNIHMIPYHFTKRKERSGIDLPPFATWENELRMKFLKSMYLNEEAFQALDDIEFLFRSMRLHDPRTRDRVDNLLIDEATRRRLYDAVDPIFMGNLLLGNTWQRRELPGIGTARQLEHEIISPTSQEVFVPVPVDGEPWDPRTIERNRQIFSSAIFYLVKFTAQYSDPRNANKGMAQEVLREMGLE